MKVGGLCSVVILVLACLPRLTMGQTAEVVDTTNEKSTPRILMRADVLSKRMSAPDTLSVFDSIRKKSFGGFFRKKRNALASLKHENLLGERTSDDSVARAGIDSINQSFAIKVDSLNKLGGGAVSLKLKTDSLDVIYREALNSHVSILQRKGLKISNKVSDISKLQPGIPTNAKGGSLPVLPNNLKLDGSVPDLALPNIETTSGIPDTKISDLKIPRVPGVPDEFTEAKNKLAKLKEADKAAGLKADAARLKEEGINSQEATEVIEGGVKRIEPLNDVQKKLPGKDVIPSPGELNADLLKNAQDTRDAKAAKNAVDKILKNEETLRVYMETMSKKKKKFDNLQDIRYVPKVKPNEMKGKPIGERLLPGMLFQIVTSGQTPTTPKSVSIFVSPELLYRVSGRISVGAGGLYRFQYTMKPSIVWDQPIYGYKVIAQVKAWKNYYFRSEWENISFYYPSAILDGRHRIWQNNVLTGVGRVQPIGGRFQGYCWAFYNLTRDQEDLFRTKLIVKTGISFRLINDRKNFVDHAKGKFRSHPKLDRAKPGVNANPPGIPRSDEL